MPRPPLPPTPPTSGAQEPTALAEFHRSVLDALSAAVTVVGTDGMVVATNSAWRVDRDGADAPRTSYAQLCAARVGPDHAYRLTSLVGRVLRGDVDRSEHDIDVSTAGAPRWLHVEAVAHTDLLGRRSALVTHTDITRHREDEARLVWLADHDQLTGLPNRHRLVRDLADAIHACAPGRPLGVVFVDIVGFSQVKDSLGSVLGDQLLRDVALRLASTLGDRGTVAAAGGDQFVLVVPATSRDELTDITHRTGEALAQPFRSHGVTGLVTGTQGVTVVTDPTLSAEEVVRDANTAMLHVRSTAGTLRTSRVAFFDETMRARLVRRVDIEAGLRHAIERDELHLVFQPIVDLSTGHVASVEALLRWIRPRRGFVPPDRFIPVAEETGLMGELGMWVLREAVAQAAEWDAAGHPVPVSVNVSVHQLVPALADEVAGLLATHGLPASRLVLEVTESAVMADPTTGMAALGALRALGCRVAMDDFGTGYSSLVNLKSMPVNIVKLDRAFVAGVADGHSADGSIVAAVLELTDALGLIAVAEGVETKEQADHLRRLGCRFGQGYLFSPPRDPSAMTQYLEHGVERTVEAGRQRAG